jgi:hypothetical protein
MLWLFLDSLLNDETTVISWSHLNGVCVVCVEAKL